MAYNEFAYWYDELNQAADYDRLVQHILFFLQNADIDKGIIADLGCGTGEASLRLARAGYDLLCCDVSPDMLSVFREKIPTRMASSIQLLCQPIEALDLYGTIRAAVCLFDTFNHLPKEKLAEALSRIALFTEPGGLLLFDANTPYKHQTILAENSFSVETPDITCNWQNHYIPDCAATRIEIEGRTKDRLAFRETFYEYGYSLSDWQEMLTKAGYSVVQMLDGDTFSSLQTESQRFFIVAQKQAVQ